MFLSLGFLFTGTFVTTPRLVVLLLFANDFVTMSIAADRVSFSRKPDRWPVRALVTSALGLAVPLLLLSFGVWWAARDVFHLDPRQIQTVVFLWLVLSGQATVYLVRERGRFWSSLPGRWLLVSSAADLVVVALLATQGWLMVAVPLGVAAWLLVPVAVYLLGSEAIKGVVLRGSGLVSSARRPA
jgi:H+-transporting ATPase